MSDSSFYYTKMHFLFAKPPLIWKSCETFFAWHQSRELLPSFQRQYQNWVMRKRKSNCESSTHMRNSAHIVLGILEEMKENAIQTPIYLHLIFAILQFEISSLMNWIFSLFQTWILQATAGKKIQFKLGKKSSSSNSIFQTGEFQKSSADR